MRDPAHFLIMSTQKLLNCFSLNWYQHANKNQVNLSILLGDLPLLVSNFSGLWPMH